MQKNKKKTFLCSQRGKHRNDESFRQGTKIVKKNEHLMYSKTYDYGGASGTPKRAHNHALSSAVAHMSLGILISNDKIFRKAFKNL